MRFQQTKDILDYARHFHKLIRQFYQRTSEAVDKNRLKLLLNYLAEHERYLEKSIAEYESTMPEKALKTWFPLSPCSEKIDNLSSLLDAQEPSVDEIVALAIYLDDCLIETYRQLAESAETNTVKDVFRNLLELEKREKYKMVRDTERMKDL